MVARPSSSAAIHLHRRISRRHGCEVALHRDVVERAGIFTSTCPSCGIRPGRGLRTRAVWNTTPLHAAWLLLLGILCLRLTVFPPLPFPDGWPALPWTVSVAMAHGKWLAAGLLVLVLAVIPLLPNVRTPLNLCETCPRRLRAAAWVSAAGMLCALAAALQAGAAFERWVMLSLVLATVRHVLWRDDVIVLVRRHKGAVVLRGPACLSRVLRQEDPRAEWTGDVQPPC